MSRKLTFRQSILLFTGAILVLSLALVIGLANYKMTNMTNQRLLETELPAILGEIRNQIQNEMTVPITIAKGMAHNSYLVDWVERGEPQEELEEIQRNLNNIAQMENLGFKPFFISAQSGNYYLPTGVFKTMSPSEARDQWFYDFLKQPIVYGLNVDVHEDTLEPTLFVNHVLEAAGQRSAIIGVGRSLSSLRQLIQDYRIGEFGKVFLVDSQGTVQIHPTDSHPHPLNHYAGDSLTAQLMSPDFSYGSHSRNGSDLIFASLPVPGIGWQIIAEIPTDELYANIRQATVQNILVGIVAAVIALVLVTLLSAKLLQPIRLVSTAMAAMAEQGGDLTQRLKVETNDEIGELATSFNRFLENLAEIISHIRATEAKLQNAVSRVAAAIDNPARRSTEQAEKSELAATAIHEMTATVAEIAQNAESAASNATRSREESHKGMSLSQDTIRSMQSLAGDMDKAAGDVDSLAAEISSISTILDTIRAVSDQTNLLALNAAIEAARAGEHGRGFAVVADEVRQLASRTAEATAEIHTKIEQLQQSAKSAVDSMHNGKSISELTVESTEKAGDALKAILALVESTSDLNIQIATATEEQSVVAEEISGNIQSIAELARLTQVDVQRSGEDCAEMNDLAQELSRSISQFRT